MTDAVPVPAAETQRALRNVSALTLATVVSKGLLFLWQLVLARFLGEAGYGLYGTIGAFIAIGAALANFGTGAIIVREVARAPGLAGNYLGVMFWLRSGLALLALLVLNGIAHLAGYDAELRNLLTLASVSLLVDTWGNLCYETLLAQERIRTTSLVTVLHMLLLLALAILALASGGGLVGLYLATIAAGLARAAMLWAPVLRSGVRPGRLSGDQLRSLLVGSLPLALTGFLSIAWLYTDKLMTARMLGAQQTGWLTAAFVIVFGMTELLGTTVLTSLFPMMSRYSGATLYNIVRRLARLTLLASLPLTLLLSFFAPEITVPLFGADFAPAAGILRIFVWYALVRLVADVYIQALITSNRQGRILLVSAAGLALNLALNAFLLPRMGVTGAAIAALISMLLGLGLLFYSTPAQAWWPLLAQSVPLLLLALVMALGMWLTAQYWSPLAGMVAGVLIYLAGLTRVLDAGDRVLLDQLRQTLPWPLRARADASGADDASDTD